MQLVLLSGRLRVLPYLAAVYKDSQRSEATENREAVKSVNVVKSLLSATGSCVSFTSRGRETEIGGSSAGRDTKDRPAWTPK